jgi:hypothetical protein
MKNFAAFADADRDLPDLFIYSRIIARTLPLILVTAHDGAGEAS